MVHRLVCGMLEQMKAPPPPLLRMFVPKTYRGTKHNGGERVTRLDISFWTSWCSTNVNEVSICYDADNSSADRHHIMHVFVCLRQQYVHHAPALHHALVIMISASCLLIHVSCLSCLLHVSRLMSACNKATHIPGTWYKFFCLKLQSEEAILLVLVPRRASCSCQIERAVFPKNNLI